MELTDYLIQKIPIHIVEIIAAIFGSIYLKKMTNRKTKQEQYLVWFLWYTAIHEIACLYTVIGYFTNYCWFSFAYEGIFQKNYWLTNIYNIISYFVLTFYFSAYFVNKKIKKIIHIYLAGFSITAISYLLFSNTFFIKSSLITNLLGMIVLVFTILYFYYELLRSDRIVKLKYYLPIYISIGTLMFSLCYFPLAIFGEHFKLINEFFIELHSSLLLVINLFMYAIFTVGFYVCSKKKQSFL